MINEFNPYYYPEHAPYRFGAFSTRYNEHTQDAHRELRDQAKEAGWTGVRTRQLTFVDRTILWKWCEENQVVPMNISYYNEYWFESEEMALLFKMTWG